MTQEFDEQLTVDLYVRAAAHIVERRDEVIGKLKRLEQRDRLTEFRIHPWPRAISLDLVKEIEGEEIHEVVRSFERWADQHGRHIQPPFNVRTADSSITGESDELLFLPVMCVAAYNEGKLIEVAPCRDGESIRTVDDALDAIAAGDIRISDPRPEGETSGPDSEQRESIEDTDQQKSSIATQLSNPTEDNE